MTTVDSYKECLRSILSFYDVHVDLDGAVDAVPKEHDHLEKKDVQFLCDKLDLDYTEKKCSFAKLSEQAVPTILLLDEGVCLYIPNPETNAGRFVFPGQSNTDKEIYETLKEKYQNKVLIIVPKEVYREVLIHRIWRAKQQHVGFGCRLHHFGRNILKLLLPQFLLIYWRLLYRFIR